MPESLFPWRYMIPVVIRHQQMAASEFLESTSYYLLRYKLLLETLAFHSFLQFQAHINSPSLSQLSLKFTVANSYWLIQQVLAGSDYSEKKHRELKYDTLPKNEVRLLPFETFLCITARKFLGDTCLKLSFFVSTFVVDLFYFKGKLMVRIVRMVTIFFFYLKVHSSFSSFLYEGGFSETAVRSCY